MLPPAIAILGPTGCGKSTFAMRVAAALPVEIISVDSAQVYRGMDIGTAKPTGDERRAVPHHLIDIRDPEQGYSAGEFRADCMKLLQQITDRGNVPLLVGGTMLYFRALFRGIADLPVADHDVRADIDARAATFGWPALHAELAARDPEGAARIHHHDAQRIQRALEVYRLTGDTITTLQQRGVSAIADVDFVEFAIAPLERGDLHTRIALRFDAMLAAGLLSEVRALYERTDLSAEHPSMRAVGYRQLWRHLAGQYSLDEAKKQAIAATRQLAKRQLTWLRKREHAQWFDSMHLEVARIVADALSKGVFAGISGITP